MPIGPEYTDEEIESFVNARMAQRVADEPKTAGVEEEVPSATSEFCNIILADITGVRDV